ncbi:LysR family transcriptional regulator [Marinobacterium jannaschii]|uniref:LysR family transcriptional regulator n=1 Tax=Marinobacterium jannaschii TaxID=64970 RepID=UPI000486C8E1|nr:LysR family transcriptional regulator [Marinobacterium jannaschii]
MNTADLALFVRTADSGSISASARQLDISPAAASAALKRLEKQLGAALFIRSTRQLRLSAEGERFLHHCRQALQALDSGRAALSAHQGQIGGEMRLSVSSDLGRNLILPWLDELMQQHPRLSILLSIGDSLADFYLDRVDVAIRYGEPEDSSLVAFKIADVERILCASPDYLQRQGYPQTPEELRQHNCLLFRLNNQVYDRWVFSDAHGRYEVEVNSNRICNDGDVVRRWAVAGRGIAFKSQLDMAEDIRAGRVVPLLQGYQTDQTSLWLICPDRNQVSPGVLLLRDRLREKCATVLAGLA